MMAEIDRRDELITDLQHRIAELEQELAARTSSTF
jgi:hypothetical protein